MRDNLLRNDAFRADALRALRTHKYDVTESGIFIPGAKALIHGHFEAAANDEPFDVAANLIVTEGLNKFLSDTLDGATPNTAHYIAIHSGASTPDAAWTSANYAANATELTTQYDEATRVLWQKGNAAGGILDNTSNPAVFTFNTAVTVRGAALLSLSTKGGITGTLIAAAQFAAAKSMADEEELRVKYVITATST